MESEKLELGYLKTGIIKRGAKILRLKTKNNI
jgi:hypothetical protein